MSRRQYRALTSRFIVLVLHPLKWRYQPERRSPNWQSMTGSPGEVALALWTDVASH
jgi:hypothetical protein